MKSNNSTSQPDQGIHARTNHREWTASSALTLPRLLALGALTLFTIGELSLPASAGGEGASETAQRKAEILELLSVDQMELWLAGTDPAEIRLDQGGTLSDYLKSVIGGPTVYHALSNRCRILRRTAPKAAGMVNFDIDGRCSVPSDAVSVALNARVLAPSRRGTIRVYPKDGLGNQILASFKAGGEDVQNMTIVRLGTDQDLTLDVRGVRATPQKIELDVVGFFGPGAAGPPGPKGDKGDKGDQGPPGATFIPGHNNCAWFKVQHAGAGPRETFCPAGQFTAGVRANETVGNLAAITHLYCCTP